MDYRISHLSLLGSSQVRTDPLLFLLKWFTPIRSSEIDQEKE